MANPVWPAELPQHFLVQGLRQTLGDPVVRSQPEIGPPRTRPRSTQAFSTWSGTIRTNKDQSAVFLAFWRDTLLFGSLPFDWVEPGTATPRTFLFMAPPARTPDQRGVRFDWQITLREVPA